MWLGYLVGQGQDRFVGRVSSTLVCLQQAAEVRMATRYRWSVLMADDEIRPSEELPESEWQSKVVAVVGKAWIESAQ